MKKHIRGLVATLPLWLALAAAQTPNPAPRITPNWQTPVDIVVLAKAVGDATGLTFIVSPQVRGTAVMASPHSMSPQEFYQFFLQILQVNGFVALRNGNTVKIVPEALALKMSGNDLPEHVNPNSDEIVTVVIQVKNVSAAQLNPILRQFVATNGLIQAVTGTNALLITDHANNVARIQKIVAELDGAGGSGVDMITLKNSNATDVANTLTKLQAGTTADPGGAPHFVADDRSNSLVISGDSAARQRLKELIESLDKPVDDNDNTERRYLRYARSDDVAAVLKQQVSGSTSTTGSTSGATAPAPAAVGPAADRSVTILSDKNTNLLIITAPPKTRRALWATVDAMDIQRAQVFIEAIIADINIDKSRDLGVNWAAFSQEDGKVVPGAVFDSPIGSTNPIDLASLAQIVADPASATTVPLGATFGIGKLVNNGKSWAAMIRAITSDTNNNVIANPTQMTLDNEQVTLQSGQNVPFISGQYTSTGAGGVNGQVTPFNTVQRQDVGTTLKITPQLNGSDAMTLTIDLDSSELAGQTGDAGSQITNKRTFHNVVLVKDQQWIVVGGLIRDSKATGETRVPFLSRIPLLGELFKARNDRRQKSNLMVFIKPTIIKDNLDVSAATNAKYNAVHDDIRKQDSPDKLPTPQLPALDVPPPAPAGRSPQTSPVP